MQLLREQTISFATCSPLPFFYSFFLSFFLLSSLLTSPSSFSPPSLLLPLSPSFLFSPPSLFPSFSFPPPSLLILPLSRTLPRTGRGTPKLSHCRGSMVFLFLIANRSVSCGSLIPRGHSCVSSVVERVEAFSRRGGEEGSPEDWSGTLPLCLGLVLILSHYFVCIHMPSVSLLSTVGVLFVRQAIEGHDWQNTRD